MFDSAKVASTESDPAPAKQAATPTAGAGARARHPGNGRSLEHAAREQSVAPRDAQVDGCSGRPLGQRLAEWSLLLDGRAGAFRDPPTPSRRRSRPRPRPARARSAWPTSRASGRRSSSGSALVRRRRRSPSPPSIRRRARSRRRRARRTCTASARTCRTSPRRSTTGISSCRRTSARAGRVQSFGKGSMPLVASSTSPFVSGLSPQGRLTSAATARPSFYGAPLIAWEPALGADQYQVQWSKTRYPWVTVGREVHLRDLGAADSPARELVLPRSRRQLLASGHRPRDVVVGAGRPQGREADLRGRQEVRPVGSRGLEPRPRTRPLARRRRRRDHAGALPRRATCTSRRSPT